MTVSRTVFIALLVLAVFQAAFYYPRLPDYVASHFSGAGHPNGWSSKVGFFVIDLGMVALMALMFLGGSAMQARLPFKTWNLPNKDYWLAPERREKTLRHIHDQMLWFGVVTLVFMLLTMQFVIGANFRPQPTLPSSFIAILLGYLVYTLVWSILFISRFRKAPTA